LQDLLAIVGGVAVALLGYYGLWYEPGRISLQEVDLTLPRLPPAWDGLTFLHLSDFHTHRLGRIERQVAALAEVIPTPDVIAFTGDFANHDAAIPACVQAIAPFTARYGKYAVLGNNDYARHLSTERLIGALEEAGVRVLINERIALSLGEATLWLAGVDMLLPEDLLAQRPFAVAETLRDVPPEDFKVLLAHTPDAFPEACATKVDLMLCGHTHGGQICLPGLGALHANVVRLSRHYAAGLFSREGTQMYISRGLGTSTIPVRLWCPPEASLLRLHPPSLGRKS